MDGPQLVYGLVGLLYLVLTLWAFIDALRKPTRAYEAAGVSKTLWVVLLLVSLFVPCGILVVLWWLISTGPKVGRQAQIGSIGFPGR
jgi:hypothetical protein